MSSDRGNALTVPTLFADEGCPYAHRVTAFLHYLGVEHDLREAPHGRLPSGLRTYSPSGRIPLIVHNGAAFSESSVILEYLAETYGHHLAFPDTAVDRARHRHAMAITDSFITPQVFPGARPVAAARTDECLDLIAQIVDEGASTTSLLAFHLAPVWLRFHWWQPAAVVTGAIAHRKGLRAWLDTVAASPAIKQTSPDRKASTAGYAAIVAKVAAASP